jgi:hypothetical protein
MDSESPTVEIGSKESGKAAMSRKRRREVENDTTLKRTRASNTKEAIAGGRRTSFAPSTSTVTRRGLRSDNAATPAAQQHSKTVGTSAPSPTGSSSALVHVEAEESSPQWFSRTIKMLQSELAMGEEWMELVRIWSSFEV